MKGRIKWNPHGASVCHDAPMVRQEFVDGRVEQICTKCYCPAEGKK
jgi:hypothetical protein